MLRLLLDSFGWWDKRMESVAQENEREEKNIMNNDNLRARVHDFEVQQSVLNYAMWQLRAHI